jgi:hypothetical protein
MIRSATVGTTWRSVFDDSHRDSGAAQIPAFDDSQHDSVDTLKIGPRWSTVQQCDHQRSAFDDSYCDRGIIRRPTIFVYKNPNIFPELRIYHCICSSTFDYQTTNIDNTNIFQKLKIYSPPTIHCKLQTIDHQSPTINRRTLNTQIFFKNKNISIIPHQLPTTKKWILNIDNPKYFSKIKNIFIIFVHRSSTTNYQPPNIEHWQSKIFSKN